MWNEIVGVIQTDGTNRVIICSRSVSTAGLVTSHVANCEIVSSHLNCAVKSFYNTYATMVNYVPFPKKIVILGAQNGYTSVAIIDSVSGTVKSFVYTSKAMKTLAFRHASSPPNYVGTFVSGTAVSASGVNFIAAGVVRTDSGTLTALYLTPVSGNILNSAELVNAMVLEYEHPDTFIAGGLEWSDGLGVNAYIVSVNSLIGSLKYGIRFRTAGATESASSLIRRVLSEPAVTFHSVVRGMVRVDAFLYLVLDKVNRSDANSTSVTVLKLNSQTGLILQQVHVISTIASLSCTEITLSPDGIFLYIACQVIQSNGIAENVVISVSCDLIFAKLPRGFSKSQEATFTAESVQFRKFTLPVSMQVSQDQIVDTDYTTQDTIPTRRPSVGPTIFPSAQPSSAPSGQPSSIPTAAPSVSPQPSSHPSTSGPTATYKPESKPTQRPSVCPSRAPTQNSSRKPTCTPTCEPSVTSSTRPSASPSATFTAAPTRTPTVRPTVKPSQVVTLRPSRSPSTVPSLAATTTIDVAGKKRQKSDLALVIGGSVIGGIVVLWCGFWFLRWFVYVLDKRKKRKALKKELFRPGLSADLLQQRILEETVQQRCNAVPPSARIHNASKIEQSEPADDLYWSNDIESPPVGAYITGIPRSPTAELNLHPQSNHLLINNSPSNISEAGSQSTIAPYQDLGEPVDTSNYSSIPSSEKGSASMYSSLDTDPINTSGSQEGEECISEFSRSGKSDADSELNCTGSEMYSLPSSISSSDSVY